MRKWLFCLLAVVLTVVGCGPKRPTAESMRAEKRAKDSIALVEQERSIAYYDSVRETLIPQADALLPQFAYAKDERYEQHGRYTHRLLRTTSNTSRNYLQACVKDNGQTEVKAFYYGEKSIDFQRITLSADSLSDSFEGSVHRFEAEGAHAMMTLQGEDALRLLHFVDAYSSSRIRVAYEDANGRSRAVFYLSQNDRQALLTTYRFGVLMHDINELDTHIRMTSIQIEKYRKRLEKQ